MSNPFTAAADTAFRLIRQKGQLMTLFQLTVGTYDPVNPAASSPQVALQTPAAGVVLPASSSTFTLLGLDDHQFSNPAQRQSFRYVLLAAKDATFRPTVDNVLRTAEGLYRVIGITPLDPTGVLPIIFHCGCTLDTQLTLNDL